MQLAWFYSGEKDVLGVIARRSIKTSLRMQFDISACKRFLIPIFHVEILYTWRAKINQVIVFKYI